MKERDLQTSRDFRETVKIWGEPRQRRRVIVAPSLSDATEKEVIVTAVESKTERPLQRGKLCAIDREIEQVKPQREELKSWVEGRKSLREDLNSMRLDTSSLKNKLNKTECESRVLSHMMETKKQKLRMLKIPEYHKAPRMSAGHMDALPLLDNPLPIALAIISDVLQEKRIRLLDLFSKADRNKDWLTTRDELKHALKLSGVPLTDVQIDELVVTLDVNNDGHLSYKELSMGIEAYRKDRRWQKMKSIFDIVVETSDTNVEAVDSYHARKTSTMNSLGLPNLDHTKKNVDFADRMSSCREKEYSKHQRNVKIRDGVKTNYITTLSGFVGECKISYLEFIDSECKRCIQEIHSKELPIKSEDLVKILIPPSENPRIVCEGYIASDRSIFPTNHRMNRRYRSSQIGKLNLQSTSSSVTKTSSASTASTLPRVASVDFKNRAKEGKKRREQFSRTSPTPCWPQHLLDKLRIYMDGDTSNDGKEALFTRIK